VIGALENAEDYKAFEATIIADYDAQSAVECGLVLRLASLLRLWLWRLRRVTTMETGLFEIQAGHISAVRQSRQLQQASREVVYVMFGTVSGVASSEMASPGAAEGSTADFCSAATSPGPALASWTGSAPTRFNGNIARIGLSYKFAG